MGVLSDEKLAELRSTTISERGNKLDVAIRLSRLTQTHIAQSIGVEATLISNLKLGNRRRLPLAIATKIADYFGCEPTDLFPPEDIIRELTMLPDLPRPVERARSSRAGTKRPHRAQRKQPDLIYPLPPHLEKQRIAVFEMLTDARLAKGLTLQEVADRLNRTRQQVEQWESAARHLRIDSLMEWADALGFRFCLEPVQMTTLLTSECHGTSSVQ
jgi:transcriptional regulator with XRE-family HTH domain